MESEIADVCMDKHGNTRVHKYTTSSSRVTIDEVHAKEPQIKRIPIIEASQRMPQKQKTRKTIAELAQEVASLVETCKESTMSTLPSPRPSTNC
jgi:hypothetical protein